jgi:methyl-accepting chemotaxis protein
MAQPMKAKSILGQWSAILFLLALLGGILPVMAIGRMRSALMALASSEAGGLSVDFVLRRCAEVAGESSGWMVAVVAVAAAGLAAAGLFRRAVRLAFVDPVSELTSRLRRINSGEWGLRMPVQQEEQLAPLANAINESVAMSEEFRSGSRRLYSSYRDCGTALLELYQGPAILLGTGGGVMLANEAGRQVLSGSGGRLLASRFADVAASEERPTTLASGGAVYRIQPCATVQGFKGMLVLAEEAAGGAAKPEEA